MATKAIQRFHPALADEMIAHLTDPTILDVVRCERVIKVDAAVIPLTVSLAVDEMNGRIDTSLLIERSERYAPGRAPFGFAGLPDGMLMTMTRPTAFDLLALGHAIIALANKAERTGMLPVTTVEG